MSNNYNIHNTPILVRPTVETAARLALYAKEHGITRAMATKRLLDENPTLNAIELGDEGAKIVKKLLQHNIDERNRKLKEQKKASDIRFK